MKAGTVLENFVYTTVTLAPPPFHKPANATELDYIRTLDIQLEIRVLDVEYQNTHLLSNRCL